jgi:hypothetical protein
MPQNVRLWEIDPTGPRDLPQSRLELESRLEAWLEIDPTMLGSDYLVIGKQVQTDFGGYIDLLCLDERGDVVVVELKRDKTPREITAQALDYGSWVATLDAERIGQIASSYLGATGSLEDAFAAKFRYDLPETLNQSHKLLIVAASIDPSSERIVRYLSEHYGVSINVVTFQYFRARGNGEFLARVFLTEPNQLEQQTRIKSTKRKPSLTQQEIQDLAEEIGVGSEYQRVLEVLRPWFDGIRTTRSTVNFIRNDDGSRVVVLNLVPAESSRENGIRFQVYATRLARIAGVPEEDLRAALPSNAEPWSFGSSDPEWSGYTGYWTPEQVEAFHATVLTRR